MPAAAAPFSPLGLDVDISAVEAVCIGTGRFLRACLVPALAEIGCEVVLAQTRGSSFVAHMARRPSRTYEVDSVLQDGRVLTNSYPVAAVGSLGDAAGRAAFMELPKRMKRLRYIGLGLTEAGITHNGRSIVDLAEFLHGCFAAGLGAGTGAPLSLINTDNMPFNGDAIRQHVGACDFTWVGPDGRQRALAGFSAWLEQSVVFHNSMVDRITSHREADADVPRAELLPCKVRVVGTWPYTHAMHMPCTCHAPGTHMQCTRHAPGTTCSAHAMHVRTCHAHARRSSSRMCAACCPRSSARWRAWRCARSRASCTWTCSSSCGSPTAYTRPWST